MHLCNWLDDLLRCTLPTLHGWRSPIAHQTLIHPWIWYNIFRIILHPIGKILHIVVYILVVWQLVLNVFTFSALVCLFNGRFMIVTKSSSLEGYVVKTFCKFIDCSRALYFLQAIEDIFEFLNKGFSYGCVTVAFPLHMVCRVTFSITLFASAFVVVKFVCRVQSVSIPALIPPKSTLGCWQASYQFCTVMDLLLVQSLP